MGDVQFDKWMEYWIVWFPVSVNTWSKGRDVGSYL